MEEGNVTVDGVSRKVPEPFIVMATQNPKGSAGTQMLPESQLDRFMICMSMGYPDMKSEIEIAKGKAAEDPMESITTVINRDTLKQLRKASNEVFLHDNIYKYMAKLVASTRENPYIELGVSPRGMIALSKMVKSCAFLNGRSYGIQEDVEQVFLDVTKHRILLNTKARVTQVTEEAVLQKILEDTAKPTAFKERAEYHD